MGFRPLLPVTSRSCIVLAMMENRKFVVEDTVLSSAEEIFDLWTSSEGHTAMTGAAAQCDAKDGSAFSAWDGYIQGTNRELQRPTKIVQAWRTAQFADSEEDSLLTIELVAIDNATRIVITHEQLPEHGQQYEQGWVDHYFEPMKQFFTAKNG